MRWRKHGLLYEPPGDGSWRHSHASIPTPWLRRDGTLRLFVGFCEPGPVSRIGYIDVDPDHPRDVRGVSSGPCLDIGENGAFDDNGVMPISVVEQAGHLYLFYAGFQLQTKIRYTIFAGLAVSRDGGQTFIRCQRTPLLERSDAELFFRTAPWVMADGAGWRMWYIAGSQWLRDGEDTKPRYGLRHATSRDLTRWPAIGQECTLELAPDEYGLGRPVIYRCDRDGYHMVYCARTFTRGYRIGFAQSLDGIAWRKIASQGLDPGEAVWDRLMTCYAYPYVHRNRTWLFYNGNNFGESGVGYAELIDHPSF